MSLFEVPASGPLSAELSVILDRVRASCGIDFTLYRRSTIERRTLGRMHLSGAKDYQSYLELLKRNPQEVDRLVAYLTIKVGRFFRDRAVFDLIREVGLPALREQRRGQPIRVWSAGCGNGEEAYGLAMLLDMTEPAASGSFVVGSDVDEEALQRARAGRYQSAALADLLPVEVDRYFSCEASRHGTDRVVRESLRRRTRFVNHNIGTAKSPPGGTLFDIILCRNVLIYFGQPLQEVAESLLLRSLAPQGLLCLGEAEWPLPKVLRQLEVVDRQARLFRLKGAAVEGGAG